MPALVHTLLMTASITGVYLWLLEPALNRYSLQAFVLSVLLYFIVKRINKSKLWHILPNTMSVETALATFAFLLLIGSTGNMDSVFYPLTFVHLFFIVFSSHTKTAIFTTGVLMIFHYALSPTLTNSHISSLTTLPLILVFFLFAKDQHEEALRERVIIQAEEKELTVFRKEDIQIKKFLTGFLQPKLDQFTSLLDYPLKNKQAIKEQVKIVNIEVENILGKITKPNSKKGPAKK